MIASSMEDKNPSEDSGVAIVPWNWTPAHNTEMVGGQSASSGRHVLLSRRSKVDLTQQGAYGTLVPLCTLDQH
jgi:hypothetical protein